jgi:GNAT superfamily N-acetyltransferase
VFTPTDACVQRLDDHLVLTSVSTMDDVDRLAEFNGLIHDAHVADVTRALILYHPFTRPEHWLFVTDEHTGQIVSSVCLIPWTWRYGEVELKVGEQGIVGTLPEYRHRGLIRALNRRFKELLRDEEFDLSPIEGIPYFYRQFGYEYAIPLDGGWQIDAHQMPDGLPPGESYQFRRATLDDLSALVRLYNEAACDLDIHAVRPAAAWRYLIEHEPHTASASETWLVLDEFGEIVGYWRMEKYGFGEGLIVGDTSRLSHPVAVAVLCKVKALATERGKPYIRLASADSSSLIRTARAWGAQNMGRYAWQIHIPDPARLLRTIAPALERRIAASSFAGLTQTVHLNLYRESLDLRFEKGRLVAVDAVGFSDEGEIRLPPLLLAPLVLGWRSREELHQSYPDVSIWGQSAYLIDVLFPKMASFISATY